MLLRDRIERVGDHMFRLRGVLPLVALLELPLVYLRAGSGSQLQTGGLYEIGCIAIGLIGLAARFQMVGAVARGTSGRNVRRQRAHSLNTTGAYSVVRNPLYLANFLCWTSASLLLRDPLVIVANTFLFFAFYLLIIFREEAFLEQEFGDAYREFAEKVPCLVPKPWLWKPPAQAFSLRRALRREHDGLLSLAAALFAVDAAHHWMIPGRGPIEPAWFVGLGVTLLVWAVLKSAKKFTGLLTPSATATPR